jgi:putative transposase
MGIRPSMGSVGDCYANAMAESFFASLECELLAKRRFRNQTEAKLAVFEYIEDGTTRSAYPALGYLSPVNFERRYAVQQPLH